jgi:hypothetical protein
MHGCMKACGLLIIERSMVYIKRELQRWAKTMFGVQLIYEFVKKHEKTFLHQFRNEGYFLFADKQEWKFG